MTGCAAAIALLASACGLFEELPPVPTATPLAGNTIVNGGFEDGNVPWGSPASPDRQSFEISGDIALTGSRSLALALEGNAAATGTRIGGAVQAVTATEFPEVLSGFYFVEAWQPGSALPYIEFVVAVRGGDFGDGLPSHEIRFVLAGATRPPLELAAAAKYVFINRDQPKAGEWTYFSYPVHFAFETNWGKAPTRWDAIDLSFEVRYDGRTAGEDATSVRMFFDDLYFGQQILDPNRPPGFDDDD